MTEAAKQASFTLNVQDELNDLRMSDKALPLYNQVKQFIKDVVQPMSEEFHRLGEGKTDIWSYAPGQLEVLEAAKDKAKAENRAPESVAAAETLLTEDVARIGDFNGRDSDGTTPGADGLEGVRTVEDRRFDAIQQCRRQIDALLTALEK